MIKFIKKYWQALRLSEVSLMSGFFLIGSFFAIDCYDQENIVKIILLGVLSFSIVLSVYSFNSAAGKENDSNNIRLKNLWNFSKNKFLIFAFIFFIISISLSFILNNFASILSILIIFLWILYSHKTIGLKQKAIYGTLIHFFAQILHFILAWIIFKDFSYEVIFIAIFFSIAFSSGHLLHEIIDYESDKITGFKTSAIKFGVKTVAKSISLLLFINIIIISLLFYFSHISKIAFISFAIANLIHFGIIVLNVNNILQKSLFIRKTYRLVYLLAGLIFILFTIIQAV